MKKWPEIIFALLCLILCASLSLGMLVFGPAEAAANERLASKPKLRSGTRIISPTWQSMWGIAFSSGRSSSPAGAGLPPSWAAAP